MKGKVPNCTSYLPSLSAQGLYGRKVNAAASGMKTHMHSQASNLFVGFKPVCVFEVLNSPNVFRRLESCAGGRKLFACMATRSPGPKFSL